MPVQPRTSPDLTLHGSRSFEPPYDDELSDVQQLTSGSLALALPLRESESAPPALRVLTGGRRGSTPSPTQSRTRRRRAADEAVPDTQPAAEEVISPARRTARGQLPPPKTFGARLVQALTEATAGERPLAQLSPYLSRPVYDRLERHFAATVRGTGAVGVDNRAAVRSVHVCEPSDGVAELAAVVRRGTRMAAFALRLEGIDGRWQCTALQMG